MIHCTTKKEPPLCPISSRAGRGRLCTPKVYELVDLLGQGCFGKVYKAREALAVNHESSRPFLALKRILKHGRAASREVDVLRRIGPHRSVVQLLDHFFSILGHDTSCSLFVHNLVFEFMPCTLSQMLKHTGSLPRHESRRYFSQLCLGLAHIHSLGICHRDLKPDNLLLNPSSGELKICDFGSAKELNVWDDSSYVCNRLYRAPELLLGQRHYTTKVIFGNECQKYRNVEPKPSGLLWEMLCGVPFFQGWDDNNQLVNIVMILGSPAFADLAAISKSLAKKWQSALPLDIQRLDFEMLLAKDDSETASLTAALLVYNPNTRLSAEAVLQHLQES